MRLTWLLKFCLLSLKYPNNSLSLVLCKINKYFLLAILLKLGISSYQHFSVFQSWEHLKFWRLLRIGTSNFKRSSSKIFTNCRTNLIPDAGIVHTRQPTSFLLSVPNASFLSGRLDTTKTTFIMARLLPRSIGPSPRHIGLTSRTSWCHVGSCSQSISARPPYGLGRFDFPKVLCFFLPVSQSSYFASKN